MTSAFVAHTLEHENRLEGPVPVINNEVFKDGETVLVDRLGLVFKPLLVERLVHNIKLMC